MESTNREPDAIPRDPPDQQADPDAEEREAEEPAPEGTDTDPETGADATVPDSDVAGTGRSGAPHAPGIRSDQPVPDEPAD